jgi:hypothetical protein
MSASKENIEKVDVHSDIEANVVKSPEVKINKSKAGAKEKTEQPKASVKKTASKTKKVAEVKTEAKPEKTDSSTANSKSKKAPSVNPEAVSEESESTIPEAKEVSAKKSVPKKATATQKTSAAKPEHKKTDKTPGLAAKATPKSKPVGSTQKSSTVQNDVVQEKEKTLELSLEETSGTVLEKQPAAKIVVKNESTRPVHGPSSGVSSSLEQGDMKSGVRRKGPIGSKTKKLVKTKKSEFGMRMCIRCPNPFEPVEEEEVVCPKCKDAVQMRFSQLFGDEDPYSPQPTLRTNKIARVIFRNNKKNEIREEDRDIAEESLDPIDRYDDE